MEVYPHSNAVPCGINRDGLKALMASNGISPPTQRRRIELMRCHGVTNNTAKFKIANFGFQPELIHAIVNTELLLLFVIRQQQQHGDQ